MSKIGKMIFFGIVILLLLATFVIIFGIEDSKTIETTKKSAGVSLGMGLAYVLSGIGVIGMAVIAIKGMMDKPKSAVRTAIGAGLILVLFLIGYLIDGGATPANWQEFGVKTASRSKFIGGSLIMMYIGLIVGVLIIIFGPFLRLIKK
jgi:hypothetical protein